VFRIVNVLFELGCGALRRVIIHIDMDAFYTSIEQRENPTIRDKPVIVGADPKGGKGRGVVAACSYEARKFGVHSAQPISQAYRLCPEGVYLRPNYELYEEASEQVMQILRPYAAKLEQISIDEAFMDLTEKVADFDQATLLATRIKQDIKEKTRLTCSIGIAPNKSVAKIASDFKKPDGLTVVPPEKVREFLAPLPVSKISGIGKKSTEVLKQLGINSIAELASTHPVKLTDTFGKYGTRLWQVANGVDDEEVITSYPIKSISSETTFEEDVGDREKAMEAFNSLIDDVHARSIQQNMLFRTVGIKVRLEDFTTFTRAKSHTRHTNEKAVMQEYVRALFSEFETSRKKVRLVGVRLSNLKAADKAQETILNWAQSLE
jgi:DNA polymerase IV (DinB-like DNA polymerase)